MRQTMVEMAAHAMQMRQHGAQEAGFSRREGKLVFLICAMPC